MSERPVVTRGGNVERVARCVLTSRSGTWSYAEHHRAEIDALWLASAAAQPGLFNGTIYMLETQALSAGEFSATFLPVDFKCFYHWRACGFPAAGLCDSFGSALIRSVDGHVLLGRQRAGNLNAGLSYLPGGFIDPRDVAPTGRIDIAGSIWREVMEETGLEASDLVPVPGFLLTRCGHQISICIEYRSWLSAQALADKVGAFLARDAGSELVGIDMVRSMADLAALDLPPFTDVLLRWLFGGSRAA